MQHTNSNQQQEAQEKQPASATMLMPEIFITYPRIIIIIISAILNKSLADLLTRKRSGASGENDEVWVKRGDSMEEVR